MSRKYLMCYLRQLRREPNESGCGCGDRGREGRERQAGLLSTAESDLELVACLGAAVAADCVGQVYFL